MNSASVANGSADHGRKRFNVNFVFLVRLHVNEDVVVILLGRLSIPIEIRRIVRRHFDGRLSGKDRILFRASAAEQQVFHAVDVVYLRGVVVPVEYDISISLA